MAIIKDIISGLYLIYAGNIKVNNLCLYAINLIIFNGCKIHQLYAL
jgi:hypothetical protein